MGLAYSGILWHTLAYSGILWHTLAYSGILWHTLAYSGLLWHTLAYSCTLWHTQLSSSSPVSSALQLPLPIGDDGIPQCGSDSLKGSRMHNLSAQLQFTRQLSSLSPPICLQIYVFLS